MSDTAIKVKCPRCGAWMVGFVDLAGADEKENAGGRALAEKIIQSRNDPLRNVRHVDKYGIMTVSALLA